MSPDTYRLIHILGILMLFSGLVGLWGISAAGLTKKSWRIVLSATHGVGMLLIIVSGFGMAARLGFMEHLPVWIYLKLSIWLLLGGSMVLARRKAQFGPSLIALWIFLGASAAYLALFKPV